MFFAFQLSSLRSELPSIVRSVQKGNYRENIINDKGNAALCRLLKWRGSKRCLGQIAATITRRRRLGRLLQVAVGSQRLAKPGSTGQSWFHRAAISLKYCDARPVQQRCSCARVPPTVQYSIARFGRSNRKGLVPTRVPGEILQATGAEGPVLARCLVLVHCSDQQTPFSELGKFCTL